VEGEGGQSDAIAESSPYFLFPLMCANNNIAMMMTNISMTTANRALSSIM
jgi:hypothetical protein